MNRACTVCERFSSDGNLWCERAQCPIDELHTILDYGEQFGEFKIIRLVRLLSTSMLYEAEQQGDAVLLKIAHQGREEFLKQEASLAAGFSGHERGFLQLRAAYKASTTVSHPYGKAVFNGKTHYYAVYGHVQGEFLEDLLLKNPMPWYRDAAWITIQAARLIAELHQKCSVVHGAPLRSALLIQHDHRAVPRPILVDYGWMLPVNTPSEWSTPITGSLAPELTHRPIKAAPSADVYSLADLLHEMLSGKAKSGTDEPRMPGVLNRSDLPQADVVSAFLRKALAADPKQRPQTVSEFALELVKIFGKPPPYTRPGLWNMVVGKADWGTIAFSSMMGFLMLIILILAFNR